jgi:hypothetical protein
VHWCCERGGDGVRRRLTAALGAAPASMTAPRIPEALADLLAEHGWLGQADWDDARRYTAASVAARASEVTGESHARAAGERERRQGERVQ